MNQSSEVMSVTEVGELMVALGIVPPVEEEFTAVQLTEVQNLSRAESWCRC